MFSLVFTSNQKIMELLGEKKGYSLGENEMFTIYQPLRLYKDGTEITDLEDQDGKTKWSFCHPNGTEVQITSLEVRVRNNTYTFLTKNSVYVFRKMEG